MKSDLDDNKICPKCQMPLEKKGSGSLTQWIKVCNCGRAQTEKAVGEPIKICTMCGKRIEGGRSGTLTQWIFRADLCTCEAPTWVKEQLDAAGNAIPVETVDEFDELKELPMEAGSFPVDRYGPVRRIGMGASGTVYLCKDRLLKKKVAVKVLNNLSPEQLIAFQREAKATSQIIHPHIVKVLDFGVSDGKLPYMVLEFIDGLSLQEILEQNGPLSIDEALPIFSQICDALSFAHKRHLFHRDLKPTNIIVTGWGSENVDVRVIDFGVGVIKQEQTEQGKSVAGSPPYMSPDQAVGRSFDERSEVYSLGCVMFETLTGRPPFIGDTALQTISLHAHAEPPSLSEANDSTIFSDAAETVIATCLRKSPNDRYKDMIELKHALSDIAEHPFDDRSEFSPVASDSSGMKIWVVLSIVLVGIGTIGGAMVFGLFEQSEPVSTARKKPKYQEPKLADALDSMQTGTWYKGANTSGQLVWTSRPNLYDKDIDLLTKEPDVKRIAVGITDNITGTGFKPFVNRGIVELFIQSTGLTDEGLAQITQMKSLQTLRLALCSKLSIEGIKNITTLPELDDLSMTFMKIPDGALAEISKIKALRSVVLYNSKNIKASDVQLLGKLPNLEYLDLSSTTVKSDVIPVIVKFKSLNNVRLGNLDLTDENLELLGKLPNLTDLGLAQNPKITDQGLAKIGNCKNLETIVLDRCTGISPAARAKFFKQHPRITLQTISDTSIELEDSMESLSGR